jgi:formylglycine-generating enzyme required for sulfatase activity
MPRSTLKLSREDWASLVDTILRSGTDDFARLVAVSGLDPAKHLRFANWCGVSFADSDLRGFDFTGARLHGCDFTGSRIEGARFDQAEIDYAGAAAANALAWDDTLKWDDSSIEWGVFARPNNLRRAADWDAYVAGWQQPERIASDAHLPFGAVFQDAPFAPEMVMIPPGEFMMGSPEDEAGRYEEEGPQHKVTISQSFAIGRYAVTFDEWDFAQGHEDWRKITGIAPREPPDSGWGRGNRPVINVNWDDAQAYVKWLSAVTGRGYRLPSEAEWEYCCRAGTTTPFWWGGAITPDKANYNGKYAYERGGAKGESRGKTLPVDAFASNPWGLYQVHGNVWEWCADGFREYEATSVADPVALLGARRALRGGGWRNNARNVRAASRRAFGRDYRRNSIGFRCARVRS